MRYAIAMGLLKGQRTAVRVSVPDNRVVTRFGQQQRLNPDPTASPAYTGWTPTKDDMGADDWTVLEPDGTDVPEPRLAAGGPAADDPPTAASGGTGAGTGWRRA